MLNNHTKFLIVDDTMGVQERITNILRNLGFINVDEAEDGPLALQKLQANHFDFVITNWQMPTMDGLTMLRKIRAEEQLKNIPVLMVAAEVKKKHILDAANAGANGFLARPFTAAVLFEKLNLIKKNLQKSAVQ